MTTRDATEERAAEVVADLKEQVEAIEKTKARDGDCWDAVIITSYKAKAIIDAFALPSETASAEGEAHKLVMRLGALLREGQGGYDTRPYHYITGTVRQFADTETDAALFAVWLYCERVKRGEKPAVTETAPRWHKWPEEKPPRCDWYLVKDSRRKTPTVDHYKDWASSGDEWDGAVTHWHPLPEGPHE